MVETIMYELMKKNMTTFWGDKVKILHRLNTSDTFTADAILLYDEYMAKGFSYKNGDVFIDIGSHIGMWGLLMAIHNPSFKVHCFEALPENVEIINKLIIQNKLNNMFVYNLAITDETNSTERIYYTPDDTDFGKEHKFIGSNGGGGEHIDVPTLALGDILNYVGETKCRVMKIDCEGCELKGFASISHEDLDKIDIIVGEFHPRNITSKAFFDMFNGKFDNISQFQDSDESYVLQDFMLKRKGVKK